MSRAPAKSERVLVLGGSSVHYAWTVAEERNFPHWLDAALPEVEVVNLAAPGSRPRACDAGGAERGPVTGPDRRLCGSQRLQSGGLPWRRGRSPPRDRSSAAGPVPLVDLQPAAAHTEPLLTDPAGGRSVVPTTQDDRALRLRTEALAAYRRGPRPSRTRPRARCCSSRSCGMRIPPTGLPRKSAACVPRPRPGCGPTMRNPARERAAVAEVCGEDAALTWWLTAQEARLANRPAEARDAFRRSLDLDPLRCEPRQRPTRSAEAAAAVGAGFVDLSSELDALPPGERFTDPLPPSVPGARVLGAAIAPHVRSALDGRMPGVE